MEGQMSLGSWSMAILIPIAITFLGQAGFEFIRMTCPLANDEKCTTPFGTSLILASIGLWIGYFVESNSNDIIHISSVAVVIVLLLFSFAAWIWLIYLACIKWRYTNNLANIMGTLSFSIYLILANVK